MREVFESGQDSIFAGGDGGRWIVLTDIAAHSSLQST